MPLVKDRVKQTTTSTGTGSVALSGTVSGFQTFAQAFISGSVVYYCIADGTNWETGIGTYTAGSPGSLSRDSILASSNSGAAVSWGVGTKDVFVTLPAAAFSNLPTAGVYTGTQSKATNYNITPSDGGGVIKCTAGSTQTLPAASGLPASWWVTLSNRSSSTIVIAVTGGDMVGGSSSWTIRAWQDLTVYRTGSSTFDVLNLGSSVIEAIATWSPTAKGSDVTLSNNNLTAVCPAGNSVRAAVGASSGKRYFEITFGATGNAGFGVENAAGVLNGFIGDDSNGWAFLTDGRKFSGGTGSAYGASYGSGVTGRIAHDIDAGKMWVAIGATWQGGGDPVTGTNPMFTGVTGSTFYPAFGCYGSSTTGTGGFLSFAFTPPSGYTSYY